MRFTWRGVLGLGITLLLLWWVFRGVELGAVWQEMRGANLWLLALAVFMATVTFLLRALRWKVLLHPIHPGTSLHSRFAAVNIGFMANNLLPARVGEFARAYALGRLEPVPVSGAFASLVVERFLDGLAIVFLLFLAMALPSFPGEPATGTLSLSALIQGVTLVLGLLLAGMVFLLVFPRWTVKIEKGGARVLPEGPARLIVDAMEAFLDGLKVFRSPRLLFLAVLWSFFTWAWHSLAFWVGFLAFDIHVAYGAALFVNAMVAFAVSVPAAPGFFGTFHAGARVGLSVYGVAPGPTLAFAFGFHLGGFIPVTLMGLYFAWRLGFSLREVETSEERVEEAVEAAHPEADVGRTTGNRTPESAGSR